MKNQTHVKEQKKCFSEDILLAFNISKTKAQYCTVLKHQQILLFRHSLLPD